MNLIPKSKCRSSLVNVWLLLILVFPFTFSCNTKENKKDVETVIVYSAPKGIELSKVFKVTVEGKESPVYNAKVPAVEQIPRLNHNPSKFGIASYTTFDIRKNATVTVTHSEEVKSVKILPTSYGIEPKIDGKNITFNIDNPSHVTVEVNGKWQESLHIFVNPFETNIPDPNDPNVIYFGPGIHDITSVKVKDSTTVYIAGGAYLRAKKASEEKQYQDQTGRKRNPPTFLLEGKNITIRGRGIIDQEAISRKDRRYTVLVQDAEDVKLEGFIIHDPSHWTIPLKRANNVHIDNIKIIGRDGNSDGVDISSSTNVLVENCFLRTLDDLVVVKSRTGQGESKNIHVRKNVLWNEYAHALSIGAEVRENVSNVLFEDCDVIHDKGRESALRVYHCDDAVISDVTFQNIRVEEARRLISVWIGKTRWTKTKERGNVRNVFFKDITAVSAPIDTTLTGFQDGIDWKPYIIRDHASLELIGYDKDHTVEGVFFDNVILDGKKVEKSQLIINDFVKEVNIK
ncbi:glycosyl hydrolase family 28 protein [Lutibacter sp.]|uniref:glycosyl hydrolase family 28 protein n=1 Tax=Lutibacter sp. TaxID=1925666 RepID=UPI00356A6AFA